MNIKLIVIMMLILTYLTYAEEKGNELRLGGYIGLYMPTGTFQHNFNPSPTFGIDGSYKFGKKERIDASFGFVDWAIGDNPGVENLNFSMKYLHLGYTIFFNRKFNEFYVSTRIGLLLRNYTYKDENTNSKSDNMIYSIGVRPGYLYEISANLLLNPSLNLDLAIRNSTENYAYTDEGEIMIYYGLSLGILYNLNF